MNVIKSSLSSTLIAAGALLACMPVQAAPECGTVTPTEIRIVERATGDVGALRTYVERTAMIHHYSMLEVRDNVDAWRKTLVCRAQVAAAERAAQTAAARPDAKAGEQVVVSQR